MDAINRFFPKIIEPVEKHAQLPRSISIKPDTILKILHNHNFPVQKIWPHFTTKSINYTPAKTIFTIEKPTKTTRIEKKSHLPAWMMVLLFWSS